MYVPVADLYTITSYMSANHSIVILLHGCNHIIGTYVCMVYHSSGLPLVYLFLSIPLGFFRRGDVWSYGADVTDSNSTDPSHHSM